MSHSQRFKKRNRVHQLLFFLEIKWPLVISSIVELSTYLHLSLCPFCSKNTTKVIILFYFILLCFILFYQAVREIMSVWPELYLSSCQRLSNKGLWFKSGRSTVWPPSISFQSFSQTLIRSVGQQFFFFSLHHILQGQLDNLFSIWCKVCYEIL